MPSRLYSVGDTRPLAGLRVAIKDLFDIKGLQTSGGSQAWAYITPTANATAPAIQRIVSLNTDETLQCEYRLMSGSTISVVCLLGNTSSRNSLLALTRGTGKMSTIRLTLAEMGTSRAPLARLVVDAQLRRTTGLTMPSVAILEVQCEDLLLSPELMGESPSSSCRSELKR